MNWRFRNLSLAYPGVLGLPETLIVQYEAIDVEYEGEIVTYEYGGEDVDPGVDPNDGEP